MKPSFSKINSSDIVIQKLQNNLDNIFSYILALPFIDGTKITVAFEENKDQIVAHGLGRAYQGIFQSITNNFFSVKVSDTPNPNKDRVIILQSTGSGVSDFWVF